jgi:hypothetical protein
VALGSGHASAARTFEIIVTPPVTMTATPKYAELGIDQHLGAFAIALPVRGRGA